MYKINHSYSVDFYLRALVSQEVKGGWVGGGALLSMCIYNDLFTANQTHPSFLAVCPNG